MALLEILLQARDQTGPAFQSARTGLGNVAVSAGQTSGNLAALGAASITTATRISTLINRIELQERELGRLSAQIDITSGQYGLLSTQAAAAISRFDRASDAINQNRLALRRLESDTGTTTRSMVGLGTGIGGVNAALGTFGVYLGAREIVQFGINAGSAANSLHRTESTILALSGTQERYNEVLNLGNRAQDLYGGSLESQLENFRGLIPLSRSANVALGELDQTVRKLAILDPSSAQGGGAAIAIREFLTASDATGALSLQHRFELDKKALQDLIKEYPDATDRLRAFNDLLAQQGITNETVNAQLGTTANTYDRLGAAASDAKVRIGEILSVSFEPFAQFWTGVLTSVTDVHKGLDLVYASANNLAVLAGLDTAQSQTDRGLVTYQSLGLAAPTANVATASTRAPSTATVAPSAGQAGGAPGASGTPTTVIHQTINVQGSIHATQDLKDIAHQGLLEYQNRNGSTGLR